MARFLPPSGTMTTPAWRESPTEDSSTSSEELPVDVRASSSDIILSFDGLAGTADETNITCALPDSLSPRVSLGLQMPRWSQVRRTRTPASLLPRAI
eukprot:m.262605 g.262605  ORF g.262605 m.262605 type:complete len:97 (-) comp54624_c0_seq9:131-421(-)